MSYVKTKWKDKIVNEVGEIIQEGTPLSAENLNNIEAGIEENTEQLLTIEQEVSNNTNELNNLKKETDIKENQIAAAIKKNDIEGYGLKYLVRSDAEIISSTTQGTEKTIICPEDKLLYIISGQVITEYIKNSGSSLKINAGYLKTLNQNEECLTTYEEIKSFYHHSGNGSGTWNSLTNLNNILFSNNFITNNGTLKVTAIANLYDWIISDINPNHYSILELKSISKIKIKNAQVTYLLLDKNKEGIDYSDFN